MYRYCVHAKLILSSLSPLPFGLGQGHEGCYLRGVHRVQNFLEMGKTLVYFAWNGHYFIIIYIYMVREEALGA